MDETIKQKIERIVTDETLTDVERSDRLAPFIRQHFDSYRNAAEMDEMFNDWNLAMAEIVERNGLARH